MHACPYSTTHQVGHFYRGGSRTRMLEVVTLTRYCAPKDRGSLYDTWGTIGREPGRGSEEQKALGVAC
jgi:hypothetical protein